MKGDFVKKAGLIWQMQKRCLKQSSVFVLRKGGGEEEERKEDGRREG